MATGTTCGLHSFQETDGKKVTDTVCCVKSIEGEDHPFFSLNSGKGEVADPCPLVRTPLSIITRSDPIRPDVISDPARPDPIPHPTQSDPYDI